jgi:hypothetical protein
MLMKSLIRWGVTAVAALLVVATAAPALAANDVTVGEFVQRLAMVKNLNATDARIAVDSLEAVGVRLPAELKLSARLTEGDVVTISRAVGLRVTSSHPERQFTGDQVDSYFAAFSDEFDGDEGAGTYTEYPYGTGKGKGWGPPFDPFTKGKGQAKGKAKGWRSPTEPE